MFFINFTRYGLRMRSFDLRKCIVLFLFVTSLSYLGCRQRLASVQQERWQLAADQAKIMLEEVKAIQLTSPGLISPRSLNDKGELVAVRSADWTSGFFPGVLWFLYARTGDQAWMERAKAATASVEIEQYNGKTHDMGFKIYCSVGNGYRLTEDPHYKHVLITAATTLSTRFNPIVGCIRSWDHSSQKWEFPVIIDNMMNLELLFAATKLTGDSSFYKIAVTHANTTMKNHFRPDYSTYHVVGYDAKTGGVLQQNTHQGYSDESTWARGQAWALYGYTMCYRETHDQRYLQRAEEVAKWLFAHPNLPADYIPYWDFNAPDIPNAPRDVSAAAVVASALIELSHFSANGRRHIAHAKKILSSISNHYSSKKGEHKGFLLLHSTGAKPSELEVDKPLAYADYYFLEALLRLDDCMSSVKN